MQHHGLRGAWASPSYTITRPLRAVFLIALSSVLLALAMCGQGQAAADPTVAAVGDMACSPWNPNYNNGDGTATDCRHRYVSDVVVGLAPTALLDLGDNQYDGQLEEYQLSYDPTFGRANGYVYPSLGNAEYDNPNARGYFDYFASAGVTARIGSSGADATNFASGYYSFDIGAWHVIALNSNCTIVSCAAGSPQELWLKSDLAAHPDRCTL